MITCTATEYRLNEENNWVESSVESWEVSKAFHATISAQLLKQTNPNTILIHNSDGFMTSESVVNIQEGYRLDMEYTEEL